MTLRELVEQDTPLKRTSNHGGGEWHGACPACGGSDRFIVWPEAGRYWCRQCNCKGDTIEFLRRFRGMSFPEAARAVGKELPENDRRRRELIAQDHVLTQYYEWWHEQLRAWNDLSEEVMIAETAFRSMSRAPETWPEEEQDFWCTRLGDLYFRQSVDRQLLNISEEELFAVWREERRG